jgi:hypothetical protein
MWAPDDSRPKAGPQLPVTVEKMRSPDLLSSVCHDLRAPLASIVMGAGYLRRTLSPDDQAGRRVLEAMQRAADGMSQVISTFSDLARLEMHELTLEIAPHDVATMVRVAFDELVAEPAAQGLAISLELEPDIPALPCDRERILRVLHQLAEVALRILPDRGTVVLRVQAHGGSTVRFEVVIRRHPDPSSRRITTEPPRPALALAKGLVELHGGCFTGTQDEDACTLSFGVPFLRSPQPVPDVDAMRPDDGALDATHGSKASSTGVDSDVTRKRQE